MTPGVRVALRTGLVFLALGLGVFSTWLLLSPRTFYADVPGVSLLPPYNNHLMSDIGGLYLAEAVVFAVAAITLDRLLVRTSLAAYLVCQVAHSIFHLSHLAGFDTSDTITQTALLAFGLMVPLALLGLTRVDNPRVLRGNRRGSAVAER